MFSFLGGTFFQNIATIFTTKEYILMFLQGMGCTLLISVGAAAIGVVLGTLVAIARIMPANNWATKALKVVCNVYTTIIRGTPMALQLFIMAFVIFAIRGFPMTVVAILAFGFNSGAYVSESIRAGIMSVDIGQTEAGRALGLSYGKTLIKIVIPQAIKNVIPAIGNELIALVKETSIVSMVGGLYDITLVAKILGGGDKLANYLAPMVVAAVFYLVIVYAITFIIKLIEKRLRASDKR